LLIIFMVLSPMKPHQFESRIPQKPYENRMDPVDLITLVVTIPAAGGYKLNQREIATREELGKLLFKALDGRPADRKAVFIKAPKSLIYSEVIKVVDVVKGAGAFPIGLQIDSLEKGSGI
jgi:biopolymer transport protein ExbD